VGHFWRMVWEGNIELIIMILKDIDEEYPYWSEQTNKMKEDDSIKVIRFTEETLPEPGLIKRVIWISDGETEK
jgi:protein tyrosine phosphatase